MGPCFRRDDIQRGGWIKSRSSCHSTVMGAVSLAEKPSSPSHWNAMVPVAATASQNAATAQEAALSTRQLALGIAEIDSTARALRNQAEQLEGLVAKFIFEDSRESSVDVPRKLVAVRG